MNKTTKRSIIVSAILAIMLCVSLTAGATFALFTSEKQTNIAVTSGKVEVVANVDESNVYTKSLTSGYIEGKNNMYQATATFGENGLTLENMVEGDGIKFDIVVKNYSSVTVKFRTILACEDNGLFDGLNVKINNEDYKGETRISKYETLEAQVKGNETIATIPVEIELPEGAGNAYQGKTCTISYKVEAVQGNATVSDFDANTYYVYNANDLMALQSAKGVSKVEFLNNIDMSGKDWKGLLGGTAGLNFAGGGIIIIGNGKYISNLSAPFIAETTYKVEINDLTIKNSDMARACKNEGFGAFAQYVDSTNVYLTNCHLIDSKLNTTEDTRVGGLLGVVYGNAYITNCSVENCELSAFGTCGGLVAYVGFAGTEAQITSCTVSETKIDSTDDGNWRVGTLIGTVGVATTANGCTSKDNTLSQTGKVAPVPAHELFGRISDNGSFETETTVWCKAAYLANVLNANNGNVTLTKDYNLVSAWTPIGISQQSYNINCGKNGHYISGLTASLFTNHVVLNINGLTIKDSVIDVTYASAMANGALVSYNNGVDYTVTLVNCHLYNVTVKNNGTDIKAGGFIGQQDGGKVIAKSCTVENSTIEGNSSAGAIVGHFMANAQDNLMQECKINNCKITSDEKDASYRVGALVGTVTGNGDLTISNCTESKNTISMLNSNETNLNPEQNLYGRTVGNVKVTIK